MSVLVDANIYLAVILDGPEKKRIIELTQNSELVSPLVLPYEIGNALSAMFKRDRLTKVQILNCFNIYNTIPVRLVDVDIKVALQMASDFNIYAYDAYYLEIAKPVYIQPSLIRHENDVSGIRDGNPRMGGYSMRVFTYSEAKQNFASLLNMALKEDVVITKKDGSRFKIIPVSNTKVKSPFDVQGIKSNIKTDEILDFIRESREI